MAETIAKIAVSAATYWVDRPYDYKIPDKLLGQVVPGSRVVVPFGKGNRRTEGIVLALAEAGAYDKLKCVETVLDEQPVLTDEQIHLALWMRERFFCTVYDAVKTMLPAGLWFDLQLIYRLADGIDRAEALDQVSHSEKEAQILEAIFAAGGSCELRQLNQLFGGSSPRAALQSLVKKGILVTEGTEKRRVQDKLLQFASLAIPAEEALALAEKKCRRAPQQASILQLLSAVGRASVPEICYFTGAPKASLTALQKNGAVTIELDEVFRRPDFHCGEIAPIPALSAEQEEAFSGIRQLAECNKAQAALLFGVTGSGKTTVYIHLIDMMLKQGKGVILLVPEIALTPQMLQTFSSYFSDTIAILHSSLAAGERYDEWKRIRNGQAKLVIGTRSAVFAPVQHLGMIIIDEEQEGSYKSENAPRYHARDIAKYRCNKNRALLLLGSATPDIESRYYAASGRYHYFTLLERYNQQALPYVLIVDMKQELRAGNGSSISSLLRKELAENLERGEQSILFLNRRGANRMITCMDCGYTYRCPRCSVNLTYHSANRRLMCHYCGFSQPADADCPACGGLLRHVGTGTQQVETELEALFPGITLLRMDTDTVAPAGSHDALLSRFQDEQIPIMIGTQMVAKGLHFGNVTLVGVISADQSLYASDYRAAERTFSLLTQVVGRAGRGDKPGRAIIQTYTPDNQTILQAANQDYTSFYESEMQMRRLLHCPPFSELYAITASGLQESTVLQACLRIRDLLLQEFTGSQDIRILGPAPLPVAKVNNRFRYRITISCRDGKPVRTMLAAILSHCGSAKEYKGVSVYADQNPSE
ncbi:MAG: replication restart helicase PriA [Oscillospiraceae bacterium]|jgi:primosomal protein N' (replication factor Y)